MTMLYATGFDLFTTLADAQLDNWFQNGSGGGDVLDIQTSNGRLSGACLRINRGNGTGNAAIGAFRSIGTITAQSFVGFAFNFAGTPVATFGQHLIQILDNGSVQIDLRLNSDGSLTLTRNGTTIGSAPAATVSFNTYHYYELGFLIAGGTGGNVTVRRDATPIITVTGVNTQATANASWSQIQFGVGNVPTQLPLVDFRYDDVYVCDSNGPVNNTFLGDITVRGLLPSANGSNSLFTRVGGTASGNFTAVDEKPHDGDTSYVISNLSNAEDTYVYPALPITTSQVLAVVAKPIMRKDDSGIRHIQTRYRAIDAVEADFTGADMNLSVSYNQFSQIQETNPRTTVQWTATDLSAGEFGPHITV